MNKMGSFSGKLLLIFLGFVYFIELSSQSSNPTSNPLLINRTTPQGRMELPSPYYYDENQNYQIRAVGHPNCIPIIQRGVFIGMTDRVRFYPIIVEGRIIVINFNTRRYVDVKPYERKAFLQNAEANMKIIRESTSRRNNHQ